MANTADVIHVIDFIETLRLCKRPRNWGPQLLSRLHNNSLAVIKFFRCLPNVDINVSNSKTGQAVEEYLNSRKYGVKLRAALSILELPETTAEYLRGRKKQALRTNITRAKELGYITQRVNQETFYDVACELCDGLKSGEKLVAEIVGPGVLHWIVVDATNKPVAVARVLVDVNVAVIKFLGAVKSDHSGFVRYLLSADVFEELLLQGVRYIIVGASVFNLDSGLAFFQERLGFYTARVSSRFPQGRPAGIRLPQLERERH